MIIQYASDLHIDYSAMNYQTVQNHLQCEGDILVLAGDVCEHRYEKKNKMIKELMTRGWKHIIEVPGNHDHYHQNVKWKLGKECNVIIENDKCAYHYMHNNFIDIDGVRFICSTLWSKIEQNVVGIRRVMNDYVVIKGNTIDINNERNEECVKFIFDTLKKTPSTMNCVVVTHHLPLFELIDKERIGDICNEAYANKLNYMIDMYSEKINLWIHGHSHSSIDVTFDKTRFVRNPLGYFLFTVQLNPNAPYAGFVRQVVQQENQEFLPYKTIEL